MTDIVDELERLRAEVGPLRERKRENVPGRPPERRERRTYPFGLSGGLSALVVAQPHTGDDLVKLRASLDIILELLALDVSDSAQPKDDQ